MSIYVPILVQLSISVLTPSVAVILPQGIEIMEIDGYLQTLSSGTFSVRVRSNDGTIIGQLNWTSSGLQRITSIALVNVFDRLNFDVTAVGTGAAGCYVAVWYNQTATPALKSSIELLDGLVSYWRLDEVSTGVSPVTRMDATGVNANDLTDNNTVPSGLGIISSSASFNPANSEYLSQSDNASLSMGAGVRMTLTCWVQLAGNSDYGEIVSKWVPNFEYRLLYDLSLNRFAFWVSSTGADSFSVTANSLGVPALNTWYFIACSYNGSNISIQVNNGVVDSMAFTADIVDSTSTFYISSKGGTAEFWNGLIDEVGLWKRILSSADLTALYNGGLGLTYPFS